MVISQLALRNLWGAGLRTWLNVIVLSFSFIVIIWSQGLYEGMNEQVAHAMLEAEFGGGQYWQEKYDPFDPFALQEAHAKLPGRLNQLILQKQATPILITQGTIYPNRRLKMVLLKGIDPAQEILTIPAHSLAGTDEEIPALIGNRMAASSNLKIGDFLTVRWRDKNGTFDARDVRVVQIMKTVVPTIDKGQIWIPLEKLQQMTGMTNEASLVVVDKSIAAIPEVSGWSFKNHDFLLKDLHEMVQTKKIGGSIMYVILLFLAMLAIFNTQLLSIFRRRKEMGTLMALGMTRFKVIQLFTLEGAMHGVLAAVVAAIYGIPLLAWFAATGWALPQNTDSYGFALGEKLFPVYSFWLVTGTTILVLTITTIVSFLPTRRIAKLKPTDALRGKMT